MSADEKKQLLDTLVKLGKPQHPNTSVEKLRLIVQELLNPEFDSDKYKSDLEKIRKTATALGIEFTNEVSLEVLRNLINKELNPDETKTSIEEARRAKIKERNQLIRVHIEALEDNERNMTGKVFTVGNRYCTFKKYVPFGEYCGEGYHLPKAIVDVLESQKFVKKSLKKDPISGKDQIKETVSPRYSIKILPQLTEKQLKDLADRQRATNAIDNDAEVDSLI